MSPDDVGVTGYVDGATLLEWIDSVGCDVATHWSGRVCVAVAVGNVHLDRPIGVGEMVEVQADLVYTAASRMHILMTVCSSDPETARTDQSTQCTVVFEALDDSASPVDVPAWTPVTMLELQRHRQARARMRTRTRIEAEMAAACDIDACPRSRLTRHISPGPVSARLIMRCVDEAACRVGADWSGRPVIAAYIAGIHFCHRATAGGALEVAARVVHTGRRSVHIGISVMVTDGGQPAVLAHGLAVVVSLDERGRARPVPQWVPASDEDRRCSEHARQLIELRQFIEPFTMAVVGSVSTTGPASYRFARQHHARPAASGSLWIV
ncbi:acyl-CoA thioesterase [Mycobacterium sp. LTG2003]